MTIAIINKMSDLIALILNDIKSKKDEGEVDIEILKKKLKFPSEIETYIINW